MHCNHTLEVKSCFSDTFSIGEHFLFYHPQSKPLNSIESKQLKAVTVICDRVMAMLMSNDTFTLGCHRRKGNKKV